MWTTMAPDGTTITGSMFGNREIFDITLGRVTMTDPECQRLMEALAKRIREMDLSTKMEDRPPEISPLGCGEDKPC